MALNCDWMVLEMYLPLSRLNAEWKVTECNFSVFTEWWNFVLCFLDVFATTMLTVLWMTSFFFFVCMFACFFLFICLLFAGFRLIRQFFIYIEMSHLPVKIWKNYTDTFHSCPLGIEGSLACHVNLDNTCCRPLSCWAVDSCWNDLGQSRLGFNHLTLRM